MRYFLWFNIRKLKEDREYFRVSYLFTILIQLAFWFPKSGVLKFSDYFYGSIATIFFIYITFMKKNFKFQIF